MTKANSLHFTPTRQAVNSTLIAFDGFIGISQYFVDDQGIARIINISILPNKGGEYPQLAETNFTQPEYTPPAEPKVKKGKTTDEVVEEETEDIDPEPDEPEPDEPEPDTEPDEQDIEQLRQAADAYKEYLASQAQKGKEPIKKGISKSTPATKTGNTGKPTASPGNSKHTTVPTTTGNCLAAETNDRQQRLAHLNKHLFGK